MSDKISLSTLLDYKSLEEALIDFNFSKSQIRKYLSKKELSISVKAKENLEIPVNIINFNRINSVYDGQKIDTLYEDENIIAFNKPAFIHSVCQRYTDTDSIHNWISMHDPTLLSVNSSEYNRGLINRLDFETSGILIYAKNEQSFIKLRTNFKDCFKKKRYLTLVSGKLETNGELSNFLDLSGKLVKVKGIENNGVLNIDKVKYQKDKDRSLVELSLVTGHRHQIRVQLANLGHPIIGDKDYNGIKADRLMLHAFEYEFVLDDQLITIKSEVTF
jgi:23S rRNA pseudouridine1911/1915/1917 synthase